MAYYFRKKKKNKFYVYKGESVYERGISVRKKSKYIGPFDELCEYFQKAEVSILRQDHFEYGLSVVLYELTKQLGLVPILQHYVKKRVVDPHLSMRIVMMVINRVIWPCAKYSLHKWFLKSDLCNITGLSPDELASQKIYRAMDKIDEYAIQIEMAVCKVIAAQEKISFKTLYLDFTNQETYSRNHESALLAYGHNKRGRDGLYQVNISLCCDAESGIPFFHKSYAGNFNDKMFIQSYAEELRGRLESVGHKERTLLVIDRGINGKDNFDLLYSQRFDYIGGLIEKEFPEYFNILKSSLRKQLTHKRETKLPIKVKYHTQIKEVYGKKHKIITFYNQENYEDKIQKLEEDLKRYKQKCENKLKEFKQEIAKNTFKSQHNNVKKILKKIKELNKKLFPLLTLNIKSYRFQLKWKIERNEQNYKKKIEKFGIHVLFTNKLTLTSKQILKLFFNKDRIEKNFQFLKANAYTNKKIILGPMLHSKDKRIESHIYTCILALQLYQILRRRLKLSKSDLTTQQALEKLEDITCYYTRIAGKKDPIRYINDLTNSQKKVLKAFQISIFQ